MCVQMSFESQPKEFESLDLPVHSELNGYGTESLRGQEGI